MHSHTAAILSLFGDELSTPLGSDHFLAFDLGFDSRAVVSGGADDATLARSVLASSNALCAVLSEIPALAQSAITASRTGSLLEPCSWPLALLGTDLAIFAGSVFAAFLAFTIKSACSSAGGALGDKASLSRSIAGLRPPIDTFSGTKGPPRSVAKALISKNKVPPGPDFERARAASEAGANSPRSPPVRDSIQQRVEVALDRDGVFDRPQAIVHVTRGPHLGADFIELSVEISSKVEQIPARPAKGGAVP